jgi:glycosyltransferase involved in cell wall biosynthesis
MSERPIRVVALMESTAVSGPSKNLIEFARRAAQAEPGIPTVEVALVTYTRGMAESEFITAARAVGIRTFQLVERRRFDTRVIGELKRIVLDYSPDILQSHNIKSHFYVRITGLHRCFPWIVFNHGYTARDWLDRLYTQVDRWSLRAADHVIAVCQPFADRLSRRGIDRSRIRIQHNSVKPFVPPSPEEVDNKKRELGLADEAVVLCVGRLSSEKGHRDLLQAIALMAAMKDLPAFHLVLVGDGPEHQVLRETIRTLGIADRVTLTGHQTDVRSYYAMASVLALPSHSEGSPNVVLEAMAAGIPVVATAVGGVPEIIEHERTGLLVPPRTPPAMANAIARLLRDMSLRNSIGPAGRDHVRRDFTPEAYRRSLAVFYQQVRNSHPRSAAAGVQPK